MTTTLAGRALAASDDTLPDVSDLEQAEDRAAVDAMVATLVYHLRKEHPRPSPKAPALRDAHPKHHACVAATLDILPHSPEHLRSLPEQFRQGLFARPGKYKAWVRFSNAFKVRHDLERDARGMAIKVMGVPKAPDGTQDFLLVTHKVFFARTPADFVDFPAAVAGTGSSIALIMRTIGFFFGLRPFRFKLRGFIALQRSMNWCTSPLVRTYFSQTPYQYDRSVAKFRARPHQRGGPHQWVWLWIRVFLFQTSWLHRFKCERWRNALQKAMLSYLRTRPATFDFEVQLRRDGMPIDDAVVVWSSRKSPYTKVATLHIEQLSDPDLETMMAFGQHLSFTPWHHMAEHEPVGSINKARRSVYEAVSSLRHHLNHMKRREPRPGEPPGEYLREIEAHLPRAAARE